MVQLLLISKEDITEQISWAKRYAGNQDEAERLKNARITLKPNIDALLNIIEPALDKNKIGSKLAPMGFKFPTNDELNLITSKIIKEIVITSLFDEVEDIPGKPEHQYGIGFYVDTYPIFLDEKIHTTVEKTEVKKKMGGLLSEKIVTKENKLKSMGELFGKDFEADAFRLTILHKEKDKKGNLRYALRFRCNLDAGDGIVPSKLGEKYKDPAKFIENLLVATRQIEQLVNKAYLLIGYDAAPEFSLLLGPLSVDRKIGDFTKEETPNGILIGVKYV